jgi:Tfp pilus assembly protein PilO
VKIENRQQVLAIAAIALISLFLLDRVLLRPLTASWKARSEHIVKLEKDITDGQAKLKRAAAIRNRWDQMQTNTLAADNAERKLLEAFQRWSRDSNISISSIQPQWKRGDDEYMTLECHANAAGPISAISKFLYNVESDPMALRLESLEIQSRDETGQTLAVNLQVSGLVLGSFAQ